MDSPRVSILVPAYGVAHLLGEALASLQAQTFTDFEAIVVDDGAPDDVAGAFAPFAGDARFRLLLTDNGGVAVARNRAAAQARAPLLALLDGDDLYEPDYLARMVPAIEADARLGFVTCDARYIGSAARAGRRFSEFNPQAGPITLDRVIARRFNIFIGSTIRRAAFEAVGGCDERLRAVEDLDLWARLLGAGWSAAHLPEPLARYRLRSDSMSADRVRLRAAERTVLAKLAAQHREPPEAETIATRLRTLDAADAWEEGEALLMAGEVRAGLSRLSAVPDPSLRWRIALPLMRAAPMLARPLMWLRAWLPAPSRRSS